MKYTILTMALLAAGCQPEAHLEPLDCDDMSGSKLAYGDGGTVDLDAPVGLMRRLPVAANSTPLEVRWRSRDRRAADLEVQVQVVDVGDGDPQTIAENIQWKFRGHGHGDAVYDYPIVPQGSAIIGATAPTWSLPARGIRTRVAARELNVSVSHDFVGLTQGPLVQISIQPVDGSLVPVWPRSVSIAGNFSQPFPMGASEFKVSGLPPAETVRIGDLQFGVLSSAPASAYADWTPIPANAFVLEAGASTGGMASFR